MKRTAFQRQLRAVLIIGAASVGLSISFAQSLSLESVQRSLLANAPLTTPPLLATNLYTNSGSFSNSVAVSGTGFTGAARGSGEQNTLVQFGPAFLTISGSGCATSHVDCFPRDSSSQASMGYTRSVTRFAVEGIFQFTLGGIVASVGDANSIWPQNNYSYIQFVRRPDNTTIASMAIPGGAAGTTSSVVSGVFSNGTYELIADATARIQTFQAGSFTRVSWFSNLFFAAYPFPTLLISPAPEGGQLVRWPVVASNFVLESTMSLAPPIGWAVDTNSVSVSEGMFSTTVASGASNAFFRLRQLPP